MTDDPTIAELRRRFDEMREETRRSFASLGERLDRVPTTDVLALHLQSTQMQIDLVRQEIARVERDTKQRADEIDTDLQVFQGDLKANKRWAIGTALVVASVLIALSGFVFTVVSA